MLGKYQNIVTKFKNSIHTIKDRLNYEEEEMKNGMKSKMVNVQEALNEP